MSANQVTVVIPSYRSETTLPLVLAALDRQIGVEPFETIVVESGSQGAADGWKERYPSVQLIESARRLSPAAARNRGARQASGEFLAFLDADAIPVDHWLLTLLNRLRQSRIRLVSGWIANENPDPWPSCVLHWIEFSHALRGSSGHRASVASCNIMLRRNDFLQLGGFPESMEMSEDTLFCNSFGENEIWLEGAAGVRHRHRSEWPAVREHLLYLGFWSGQLRRRGGTLPWLSRFPQLSYLLAFYRLPLICSRVLVANPASLRRLLLLIPRLFGGLWYWSRGFGKGISL